MPDITFMPDRQTVRVRPGTTLLDAGRRANAGIRTRCDGKAACLMCKVIVEDDTGLAPMNRNEQLKLGSLSEMGYRLACQTRAFGNVTVTVPEDPLKAAVRALLAKQQEEDGI
ncbi:2Fe-2S iron-sulfur cluster-binding protein [Paenibacillus cymbidii]|uniref:2Fe-2S iron-sulfur cluster-binding protein n=1 Tax=Paenibacillus cymbidii TaxID=1639034 RepID=UPI001A9BF3DB|nr:2Fe-2S iron-sulfur cluster-binding protein [Paenibacillus cymbidii]